MLQIFRSVVDDPVARCARSAPAPSPPPDQAKPTSPSAPIARAPASAADLPTTIPRKRNVDVGQQPQRRPAGRCRSVGVRVAFVYDPATRPGAYGEAKLKETQDQARTVDMTVQPIALRNPDETDRVFAALPAGTNALLLENSIINLIAGQRICALAAQRGLPAVGTVPEFADAGCLMSFGENPSDLYRRAASYAWGSQLSSSVCLPLFERGATAIALVPYARLGARWFGPGGVGIKKECHPPKKARCAFGLERIKIHENTLKLTLDTLAAPGDDARHH